MTVFRIYSLKRRNYQLDILGWGPLDQLENRLRVWMAMAGTGVGVGSDGLGGRQRQEESERLKIEDVEGGAIGGADGGAIGGAEGGAIGGEENSAKGGSKSDRNAEDKWTKWRDAEKRKRKDDSVSISELESTLAAARSLSKVASSDGLAGEKTGQSP